MSSDKQSLGCPKEYSTKGGMGAALMNTPDIAVAILEALVKNLKVPVTAKIRCYEDQQKTVDFAKRLAATGISALAIHGRLKVFLAFFSFCYCKLGRKTPSSVSIWNYQSSICRTFDSGTFKRWLKLFHRSWRHKQVSKGDRNCWSACCPCCNVESVHLRPGRAAWNGRRDMWIY